MMIQHIIDFGLVVLIWIVQLIIYPGFSYYKAEDLHNWHGKYTRNITLIVMPLMIGQLSIHLYEIVDTFTLSRLAILVLISFIWLNTFLFAIPLHKRISDKIAIAEACIALTRVNWYRTILWTLVFVLGLFRL
jgi:hypothetical protein